MKKCLIVINTSKKESHAVGKEIALYLKEKGVSSSFYNFDGFSTDNPFEGMDFAITLGGDGTVLFAARGCVKLGIPVFSVNFGEFGFIASVQKQEWKKELDTFLLGKSIIEERSMLQAALVSSSLSNGRKFSSIGLNDVVICAKNSASTILLDITYNEVPLGRFKADGVIVSTATGSTAYSASAGGPIIDPELDALVLTPINSFSLSSRPLVLNPKGEIGVTIVPFRKKEAIITVDGQEPFNLEEGDMLKIRRISDRFKLVGGTSESFYNALCSKLNWSGGPRA